MPQNRWRAIANDLRERIERGEWAPGDALPTQRELMGEYDTTAQGTVARALSALTAEGVLIADPAAPRRGTRVRSRRRVRRDLVAGLRMEYEQARRGDHGQVGLFEQMTGTSPEAVEVEITYEWTAPESAAAALLRVTEGESVLMRRFRYVIEGTPHQLVTSYLPGDVAAGAGLVAESSERPGVGTMAQLQAAGCEVERVALTIGSRLATPQEASDLALPPGVPVLAHERVMHSGGRSVEMSRALVAGDRVVYSFDVDLAGEALT